MNTKIFTVPRSVQVVILHNKKYHNIYIKGFAFVCKLCIPNSFRFYFQHDNKLVVQSTIYNSKSKTFLLLYQQLIRKLIFQSSLKTKRILNIMGVGYKFYLISKKRYLVVAGGFSHLKNLVIPRLLNVVILNDKHNCIKVSGTDQNLVSQFAYNIKKLKIPDSYKGKGIKLHSETLLLKEGKKQK